MHCRPDYKGQVIRNFQVNFQAGVSVLNCLLVFQRKDLCESRKCLCQIWRFLGGGGGKIYWSFNLNGKVNFASLFLFCFR